MPRITMIETKLMSRAVAWGLAVLLAGAVPWPAKADYPGKYLKVCYSSELYTRPDLHRVTEVWITSGAGINGTYHNREEDKTIEYFLGPNNNDTTTKTEIDNDTNLEILYIRTINELMDDEWIPGGATRLSHPPQTLGSRPSPNHSTFYCQVMWRD